MSSSICPHFTQNAWKKDLCSNCFKSRDEHRQASANSGTSMAARFGARFASSAFSSSTSSSNSSGNSGSSNSAAISTIAKTEANHRKTDYPNKYKVPTKSIIKKKQLLTATGSKTSSSKGKTNRVCFSKTMSEVIGYGGEWSDQSDDDDDDDDHDFMNLANDRDEMAATSTDDEETIEMKRITRANTDFNMNNGNLLGDPQDNIKKSFAALKLGAPQVDKEGKKQTLMINVVPFGASAPESKRNSGSSNSSTITANSSTSAMTSSGTTSTAKAKFETKTEILNVKKIVTTTATSVAAATTTIATSTKNKSASSSSRVLVKEDGGSDSDGKNSPPIERAMEKSLLDEISETLEQKQSESQKLTTAVSSSTTSTVTAATASVSSSATATSKIKFEITSLSEALEGAGEKPFLDLKKPIARNTPITKEHTKPKVNVAPKYSDTESSCSDNDNSISAYYDVIETSTTTTTVMSNGNSCYENLPDGKCNAATDKSNIKPIANAAASPASTASQSQSTTGAGSEGKSSLYASSQYITDMLLSSKTRAASYNLHEGNFMSSKITADGLIVTTKCSSDDALDSTGSSFDGSSDEETSSYNMTRSESDSGIGISIGTSDYKNVHAAVAAKANAAHNSAAAAAAAAVGNAVKHERKQHASNAKSNNCNNNNNNSGSSNNNSDYEDIQVTSQPSSASQNGTSATASVSKPSSTFSLEKSRELHGEPDGSADPDGSFAAKESAQQLPALPKSPPPTKIIDARPSFLHGVQKQHPPIVLKKPDLPVKPSGVTATPPTSVGGGNVSLKSFSTNSSGSVNGGGSKRLPSSVEQQVINQLQLVMSKSNENLSLTDAASKEDAAAKLKKGRAPNPPPETMVPTPSPTPTPAMPKGSAPPTPERDYNIVVEFDAQNADSGTESSVVKSLKTTATTTATPTAATKTIELSTPKLTGSATLYSRKPPTGNTATSPMSTPSTLRSSSNSNSNSGVKTSSINAGNLSPVVREKEKRERAIINPKFRSLNTFVMQRSHAAKQLQLQNASLKQPLTPEPTPRGGANKRHPNALSMSEECLAQNFSPQPSSTITASNLSLSTATGKLTPTVPSSPQKTKSKFSIKKFLRMGASKTTDNLHKKDGVYSEICTGEELGVAGKPRLVIIHPIDINPTAVEVVKDITKTSDAVAAQTVAVVTAKPPAPPLRSTANAHESNKPARPPPPKSAELRRKQKIGLSAVSSAPSGSGSGSSNNSVLNKCSDIIGSITGGSIKCKSDNVYANLGEIRSAIAPRKPERTASMREREAQLELARKRHAGGTATGTGAGGRCETDSISICSSNGDLALEQQQQQQHQQQHSYSTNPNGSTGSIGKVYNNNNNSKNISSSKNHNDATDSGNNNNNSSRTLSPQLTTLSRSTTPQSLESVGSGVGKPPSGNSRTSTFERQKKETNTKIASKLEIFEQRANASSFNSSHGGGGGGGGGSNTNTLTSESGRPNSLKDSVRKINSTIDSYLKDKRDYENLYEFVKSPGVAAAAVAACNGNASHSGTPSPSAQSPPPPPARGVTMESSVTGATGGVGAGGSGSMQRLQLPTRNRTPQPQQQQQQQQHHMYADNVSIASYTRSEYVPVRSYGLHGSLANIPRIVSASYCGSEMGDLDIYAPYSYYGSEAGGDVAADINDSVWGMPSANKNRSGKTTNRLRMRKGRSVVHKTIEDNYTAVVVANHEALAQVLDQMQQSPIIPPALRPLANAINLRFEDFTILDGSQAFVVGKKAFHAALWATAAPVTLALSADSNQLAGVGGELSQQLSGGVCGVLNPITEFCDLVPSYHLPLMPSTEVTLLQATISVLPRLQLDTLSSIGAILKGKSHLLDKSNFNFRGSIPNLAAVTGCLKDMAGGGGSVALRNVMSVQNLCTLSEESSSSLIDKAAADAMEAEGGSGSGGGGATAAGGAATTTGMPAFDDVMTREVAFIMLQLVNGMKNLQVKAIEEMPLSLSNVVLSKDVENKDAQARLCVLQGNNNDEEEPMGTLCKCAHHALTEMLPNTKITPILADILLQERAESLSKAKSVLEFILWGPSDVVLSGSTKERELALQRWLDLERATVLHGLVRTRVELTVYDECHLLFLVRSNAKMMHDAAKIVCNYQQTNLNGGSSGSADLLSQQQQ